MSKLKAIRDKLYSRNDKFDVEYQNPDARLDDKDVEYLKSIGIKTDVHRTCINCQARQLIKYHNGGPDHKQKFEVPCGFIKNRLPAGARSTIDKMVQAGHTKFDAELYLKSTVDPVAWCNLMFGFRDDNPKFRLRNYQKEQIRCTSERMVIREGRRAGKTFSMAVKLLYMAFNMQCEGGRDSEGNQIWRGPKIMIITPYQAQVTNIFDEMENLLKRNDALVQQATTGTGGSTYVKTPNYRMEFDNGARIQGFVSGVGTKMDGSGGGTMRGQSANVIYIDEMDMVPNEIMDKVVMPIMITYPDTVLIATSTPIGKREKFYKWCLETKEFKEDYLPSTVLPQWNRQEQLILAESTKEAFEAEYLAKFSEGTYGVFKPQDILSASQEYNYRQTLNMNWWTSYAGVPRPQHLVKVMGIDWNKNAGTEFSVVAYDADTQRWIVCENVNIPATEFSGDNWKKEVIRLNYKWRPDWIYADEGYGHTIIEDLKLYSFNLRGKKNKSAMDLETEKIVDRLVSFNFSSSVELRDPITQKVIKKSGKEFLVSNTIKVMESQQVWFSHEDKTLYKQLQAYTVMKISANGKPIYGVPNKKTIGDHRLDAFMLALGGLFLQESIYAPSNAFVDSTPQSFTKEELNNRQSGLGKLSSAAALLGRLKSPDVLSGQGGGIEVLEIQGDRAKMEPVKRHSIPNRKRSASQEQSVLEHFRETSIKVPKSSADHHDISQPQVTKQNRSRNTSRIGRRKRGR
jgi:hypothetical protein